MLKLYVVQHTNGFITRVWATSDKEALIEAQKHVPLKGGKWEVIGWQTNHLFNY